MRYIGLSKLGWKVGDYILPLHFVLQWSRGSNHYSTTPRQQSHVRSTFKKIRSSDSSTSRCRKGFCKRQQKINGRGGCFKKRFHVKGTTITTTFLGFQQFMNRRQWSARCKTTHQRPLGKRYILQHPVECLGGRHYSR
jgi:hypothetical protein